MEDCRVVELRHRGEPAEFPGELHEGEIPPAKGEGAGGELHRREGGNKGKQKTNEGGRASLLSFRVGYSVTLLHGDPGTRRRGL